MKILFIGAGNMGQAIIGGIVNKRLFASKDIYIYEINEETRKNVVNSYGVNACQKFDSSISKYDIIILAIKPQVFHAILEDDMMKNLGNFINENQLIVSIMAGVSIEKLSDFFGKKSPVIRIMPNTPALIGESMSVITPCSSVSSQQLDIVKNMFKAIGKIEVMEEKYIDAVTGLSGSGPAYVFTFIEAMIQGGVLCGLSKSVAQKLTIQTIIGASSMVNEDNSAEELRHKVTSPGGTTIEGLAVLEKNKFRSAIIEAIRAAAMRSKEL